MIFRVWQNKKVSPYFNKIVIFIFYFVIAEHQPLLLSVHHPSGDAVLGHVQHPVSALQNRHSGTLFSPSDSGPTKLEDAELGQPVGDLLQLDDKQEPEQEEEIDVVGVVVGDGSNAVPVSQQGRVPRHLLSIWEGQDSSISVEKHPVLRKTRGNRNISCSSRDRPG